MKLVDTHCHFASPKLSSQVPELLLRAQKSGVSKIVNVGYDLASSQLVCEQLKLSPMLFAAVGIQPHDADSFSESAASQVLSLARSSPRVVAIGEIGLDGYYNLSNMDKQIECFEFFLDAATNQKLPVIVHMRNTFSEVKNAINPYAKKGLVGVVHCFTGTVEQARAFLDLGFFISFSGIITFKNPSEFDDVVRFVPRNRILCETDAPYLAPKPHRGKPNEPAWVVHVCEHAAKLRGEKIESFFEATTQNAHELFSRMSNE